jgi:hypothetical protein
MTIGIDSGVSGGSIVSDGVARITFDAAGNVTLPNTLLKQSKTKRNFFSAYLPTNFGTIPSATWTVVRLYTEVTDPAAVFEPTTAGRFTPNVAGWYQINCALTIAGGAGQQAVADIFKNGAVHRRIGSSVTASASPINCTFATGCSVYFNGTTDYIDMRVFTDFTTANVLGDANGEYTWFSGYLIEAD